MRRFAAVSLVLVLASACQEEGAQLETEVEALYDNSDLEVQPRGTYIVQPELEVTEPTAAPMHRILYVNFDGGTYTPGSNNSSTNRSSIVSGTSTISPWGSSSARTAVLDCVRDRFSPFNITVTDVDPGSTIHIEAVTAGRPQDVGMGSGTGGVSPFSCGIIERSIVFNFAEVYGSAYTSLCHTVAQEAAHSFGLDHEYLCEDPMTYLNGCGAKHFQDVNAPCGEFSARSCQCGGSTQNSFQRLLAAFGPAGPGVPPDVAISEPTNGAQVTRGFIVTVEASDSDSIVERVELRVDGVLQSTLITQPYIFNTPGDLSNGQHTVEATAFDQAGSSSTSIDVSVVDGDECGAGDPCPDGLECLGGTCIADDGRGLGDSCAAGSDCNSGVCATSGDDSYCSDWCDPAGDSCPAGFECKEAGDDGVCWPGAGGDDEPGNDLAGGCGVNAGGNGAGAGLMLLALFGWVAVRTKRRQG